jgi:energy-coupling factor transporter ATP-binding protein EcfA2
MSGDGDDDNVESLAAARRNQRTRKAKDWLSRLRGEGGTPAPPIDADGSLAGAECPITPLGQRNGVYYFLARSGEIREVRPRDMSVLGLLSLFDGDGAWLVDNHPKLDRKDKPTGEIDATGAGAALIRRAAAAGLWRIDTAKRSLGVWRDGTAIVAHCGDRLLIFDGNKVVDAHSGVVRSSAVYVAAPAIAEPAAVAAGKAEAASLYGAIKSLWKFGAPHLPRLLLGFIALGMLGAAPSWRVHILLIGKRGSGKSTLLNLMMAALGPQANYTNDPTEAGLRELLSDEARAIVFDEAGSRGGEEKTLRVDAIIGLLRRMAGDEGARSIRGTGSGARQFSMAGSAALAAVNAPTLDAQDRSRILEIEMLAADPSNKSAVEQAIAATEERSPALRRRALEGWPRFNDNLQVYRQALIEAQCDARQADQLGTLLAAASMMLADDAIDSDSATLLVERLGPVIRSYREEDEELSNARRCLGALMTAQIEHWKGGSKSTIGRLVQLARDPSCGSERQALRVYGLRLETNLDGRHELWIANQHGGLDRIFGGTAWADGGWRRALEQLGGDVVAGDLPRQFDGHKSRFIVLPEGYLPEPEKPLPANLPP